MNRRYCLHKKGDRTLSQTVNMHYKYAKDDATDMGQHQTSTQSVKASKKKKTIKNREQTFL